LGKLGHKNNFLDKCEKKTYCFGMAKNKPHVYKRKANGKADTGRPTKLTPEMKEKTFQFFSEYEPWYECQVEKQDKEGNVTTKMERIANPPPDFLGLAKYLEVSRKTVWEWIRDNEDFRNIIKGFGNEVYSHVLQENAIMGEYNPAFAIFAAKNRLGWKDKNEITGEGGKDLIPTEIIIKVIK
jgi:hypothetical protein